MGKEDMKRTPGASARACLILLKLNFLYQTPESFIVSQKIVGLGSRSTKIMIGEQNNARCEQFRKLLLGLLAAGVLYWFAPAAGAAGGDLDAAFNPVISPSGSVSALAMQADGKIIIGGRFSSVNKIARGGLARLNANGTLDTTFLKGQSGINAKREGPDLNDKDVYTLAVQADGKILVGGRFTSVNGITRICLARLNADGTLDVGFHNKDLGIHDTVMSLAIQPDGKILVGGNFNNVNGQPSSNVLRLSANGALDDTFPNGKCNVSGGTPALVNIVAAQTGSKILVGGFFERINEAARSSMARLNADGTLDTGFFSGKEGVVIGVYALTALSNGKILVGGTFFADNDTSGNYIARLRADGTPDTGFSNVGFLNPSNGPNNHVYVLVEQPDGKIIAGGFFTSINGVTRNHFARLNTDGTLDTGFLNSQSGTDKGVLDAAIQGDGKIIISGFFTRVNGVARSGLARLLGS